MASPGPSVCRPLYPTMYAASASGSTSLEICASIPFFFFCFPGIATNTGACSDTVYCTLLICMKMRWHHTGRLQVWSQRRMTAVQDLCWKVPLIVCWDLPIFCTLHRQPAANCCQMTWRQGWCKLMRMLLMTFEIFVVALTIVLSLLQLPISSFPDRLELDCKINIAVGFSTIVNFVYLFVVLMWCSVPGFLNMQRPEGMTCCSIIGVSFTTLLTQGKTCFQLLCRLFPCLFALYVRMHLFLMLTVCLVCGAWICWILLFPFVTLLGPACWSVLL